MAAANSRERRALTAEGLARTAVSQVTAHRPGGAAGGKEFAARVMEEKEEGLQTQLVQNQPYDESLEVNDSEEVASIYCPTPRQPAAPKTSRTQQRDDMADNSSDDYEEESHREAIKGVHLGPLPTHGSSENEDDDDSDDTDSDDGDEDEHGAPLEGAYDPADYEHLPVSAEIKDLFQYITRYTPQAIELGHKLKPFIPDFIPAVGDIDAFLKVPRPDNKPDNLGLLCLDEPSTKQSDPTVLSLWLTENSKQHNIAQVKVKSLENAEKNPKAIDTWIQTISELHRSKPPATVHYTRPIPDIDTLMQEWSPEFEALLGKVSLPTADIDCDLAAYIDMICAILDIPVYKSRIQSLHILFSLYSEFKNSQHFKALAEGKKSENFPSDAPSHAGEAETLTFY